MYKYSVRFLIVIFVAMLAGCVPNKKVAYLQYKDEYKKPESIVMDTLIRKYETGTFAYKLQPNDLLDIKIATLTQSIYNPFKDADQGLVAGQNYSQSVSATTSVQNTGYYVEHNGIVNLPIIGKIMLGGLTISQAEDTLEVYVKKYLEKPVVRIRLQNFKFSVIGEVEQKGTLTSGDNTLTLLQALAMAGGPSEFGDISRVKVLRNFGSETFVFYVNLQNEDYMNTPFYFIQPDDVIVVTPVKQRSYLKYASTNIAIFTAVMSMVLSIIALTR
ncbi:MAG TPA: polysaccharide biosynthesis/export family protein [Bacteroidales bacterium]|nr:polysaccharide biosynthesis/export family protein [Bacteroidales bacterium]